jgi:hypothetical protein
VDVGFGFRKFGNADLIGSTGTVTAGVRRCPFTRAVTSRPPVGTAGLWDTVPDCLRGEAMTQTANARFTIKSWDEKAYSEGEGVPRLTRATVTKTFTGDIEGEGQVEYLMMYRSDGTATFVGLERIVGRIGARAGSFVLQRTGVFEGGQAKESFSVIPGSATGQLSGLRGDGGSALGHEAEYPFTLNYELA